MYAVFRYLRGYLRIYITGYSTERFMNLCSAYGICLWDIEDVHAEEDSRTCGEICGKRMNIAVNDFFRLKTITHKTRTKAHIEGRYGFPFFLRRCCLHKYFFIGLLLCLFGLTMLSKCIWTIELEGNTELTGDIFEKFLENEQVHVGMKISELDIDHFEKNLRDRFSYITWTSARIVGTRLIVEVKENDVGCVDGSVSGNMLPPTDLVAQRDGTIVSMITRSGVPQKQISDSVSANEVLVSGRIPVLQDDGTLKGWHECNADADVIIEYTEPFRFEQKAEYLLKQTCGKPLHRYGIRIGKHFWEIGPYPEGEEWDKIQEYRQVSVKDFYLPFYYGQTTITQYREQKAFYSESEMKTLLLGKYRHYEEGFRQKGVQIIGKSVKIERINDGMALYGTMTLCRKTGRSVPSVTPEIQDSEETDFE